MKKTLAAMAASFLFPLAAGAQVDLHCRLLESRVLQYEPALAKIELVNNTGEPLVLSGPGQNATLAFMVEQSPGVPARTVSGSALLTQDVSLKSEESWTQTLNIAVGNDIREAGPYTVVAQVEWGDKVIQTPKMFLDVLPGLEIAKLVAGVAGRPGETRTYTLRTLNRGRQETVFLRIDDEDSGRCYGVLELGRIVRLYKPTLQVDEAGNIHVLHQSGPSQFNHSAFTPDGLPVLQEPYTADGREIRLQKEDTGRLAVEGGKPVSEDISSKSSDEITPDESLETEPTDKIETPEPVDKVEAPDADDPSRPVPASK